MSKFVIGMARADNYPATFDIRRILASDHTTGINDPIFQNVAAKNIKAHDEITHCALHDRVEWQTSGDLWPLQARISSSAEPPSRATPLERPVMFTLRDKEMASRIHKAMVHAV